MSKGTRRNDDVMGNMPEDTFERRSYPESFSLPLGWPQGTARIQVLSDRLLLLYRDIGILSNSILTHERGASLCTALRHGQGWDTALGNYQRYIKDDKEHRDIACRMAMVLIVEIEALGHHAFIPAALNSLVKRPNVLPFGSMSYLSNSPHYFSSELYTVPENLPVGDESIKLSNRIRTIGDANCFLRKKYGVIARHLNRARFFRDWRVQLGASSSSELLFNNLFSEKLSCRNQFDTALEVIKRFQGSPRASQLFTMPVELRDLVLADNGVMGLKPLEDVRCLFPGGNYTPSGRAELYLLFQSESGYALFHVYDHEIVGQSMDTTDWESFRLAVRLTVYYPFPSAADALQQCDAFSKGTMTAQLRSLLELYLPDPSSEVSKSYRLGVQDKKFGKYIKRETGIHCRSKGSVQELFRGIHLYFHRYIEQMQVPPA